MGFCPAGGAPACRFPGGARGRACLGDRVAQVAVLGRGDAADGTRRVPQLRRVLVQAGGERGRQVVLAACGSSVDPADAEHGEAEAVAGARLGAAVAMDGTGGAQPGEALLRARVGAAPTVRSLPAVGLAPGHLTRGLTRGAAQFAADRRRRARTAEAGACPAARCKAEVRVAAAFAGERQRVIEAGRRAGRHGSGVG
jgi:hypothetical protein